MAGVETQALRHITTSGGLFTENILLKLRDHPKAIEIGNTDDTLKQLNKDNRKDHIKLMRGLLNTLRDEWFKLSENLVNLSKQEFIKLWILPFLSRIGHNFEDFVLVKDENFDDEEISTINNSFTINYQTRGHNNPFFHILHYDQKLDSFNTRLDKKKSYYDLCQHFINRNKEINWLILTNGRIIRLMTKYYHSYSKGYLEFNLENILTKQDEKEFFTLYRLLHSSRFVCVKSGKSLISSFYELSKEQGIKIGENLRKNVIDVLERLGDELIHQNPRFHVDLKNKVINPEDLYHELLQIIYRLIFILYAEKREMLPDVTSIYHKHFSLSSLRLLSEAPIKPDRNVDIWNKLFILFKILKDGNDFLEVNGFNGKLFEEKNIQLINDYNLTISNDTILKLIRNLTTSKVGNIGQRINFLEISVEEIGSMYESFLDFQPMFKNDRFYLFLSEEKRKSSGSYYTSKDVVRLMISRTVNPYIKKIILNRDLSSEEQTEKLLELKACDPSCGGGSFLIALLDILGEILAKIRIKDKEPSRDELQTARRDILENCIYGVDINPFAIELTKLSLWIHASIKDKPLNFLDHHIKTGNSLVGTFIRKFLTSSKKGESKQLSLFDSVDYFKEFKREFLQIKKINDNSLNDVREKERIFNEILESAKYKKAQRILNTYIKKIIESGKKPSNFTAFMDRILNIPDKEWADRNWSEKEREIDTFSSKKRIFHWDLEFPEVFFRSNPGFDVIIGNPPYIRQEKIDEIDRNLNYKSTLENLFKIYDNKFDFALYFILRSLTITRKGGHHSFIITNKWFRAGYGKKIREFLAETYTFDSIFDLSRMKVFSSATVDTAIYIIHKRTPKSAYQFLFSEPEQITDIDKVSYLVSNEKLKNDTWTFIPKKIDQILEYIKEKGRTIDDSGISIYRGITTGCNDAFIIDSTTRKGLIQKDADVVQFIKPVLRGRNIERYSIRWPGDWIIDARPGNNIQTKKVLIDYLSQYKEKLIPKPKGFKGKWPGRARGTYKWFEFQSSTAYFKEFEKMKIISAKASKKPSFFFDYNQFYLLNTSYVYCSSECYILALLNSSVVKFYLLYEGSRLSKGFEPKVKELKNIPIIKLTHKDKGAVETLACYIQFLYHQDVMEEEIGKFFDGTILDTIIFELYFKDILDEYPPYQSISESLVELIIPLLSPIDFKKWTKICLQKQFNDENSDVVIAELKDSTLSKISRVKSLIEQDKGIYEKIDSISSQKWIKIIKKTLKVELG
ncbi:MAG: Eco57I restriction-modification methylase domain-containing protein [Promethearchaeota archaeon]